MRSHHSLYDEVLTMDEHKDADREKDLAKAKLTLTECFFALTIAITCVSLHAVFLGRILRPLDGEMRAPQKRDAD